MTELSSPPRTRVIHNPTVLTLRIVEEIERQRKSGALQQITIPPCPAKLIQLQAALRADEPDLNTVAQIATSDVAMAATLLRNANCALYAGDQPVQTVGGAMNRLGLDLTANLLVEVVLRQSIKVEHPRLKGFWEMAALRAAAMHHLARQLPGVTPELAQLYGLFCHVGIPVLLQRMPGYSGTMVEAGARRDRSYVETENANHRTDHAVVGAIVARTWRLPTDAAVAIRLHHDFSCLDGGTFSQDVRNLVAIGLIAEHLVQRHEQAPESREWQKHGEACLAFLQVDASEVELWEDQLHPALAAVTLN